MTIEDFQVPGNSAGDLFGMVGSRDPKSKVVLVTSNQGIKGHGLNHLVGDLAEIQCLPSNYTSDAHICTRAQLPLQSKQFVLQVGLFHLYICTGLRTYLEG